MLLRVRRPGLTTMEPDVGRMWAARTAQHVDLLYAQYYAQPVPLIEQFLCDDLRTIVGAWVDGSDALIAALAIHKGEKLSVRLVDAPIGATPYRPSRTARRSERHAIGRPPLYR
jgi:hypothetical protein